MNGRGNTIWERAPRGGSDAWDNGLPGQLVTEEFFGPAPVGLQAVRTDSAADLLTMPAGAVPAASGGWTIAGWHAIDVDRNAVTSFWSLDAIFSSDWHSLRTTSDGIGLRFNSGGTEVVTGPNLTVGKLYFLVVRKTAANALKLYVGDETGAALATYTGTAGAITSYAAGGFVGGDPYNQFLNGRQWGLRVWNAELSDAAVDAEYTAATAALTSNLLAQWLLDSASSPGTDSSGNGRHLTNTGGSYVLETGPTLPTGGGGGSVTVTPTALGVVTGQQAAVLATVVAPSTAGVLTGAQVPAASATIAVGATGVLTGAQAVTLGTSGNVSPAAVGVLTGLQAPSLAAALSPGAVGVLTGATAPVLAANVTPASTGVVTGARAVVLSLAVAPSAVGVLTGLQTPSLAAVVAPGGVGVLTGTQTASLAASVAVGAAGVLTGANATATATVAPVAAVGVLTGTQAVAFEPPLPDVWAYVGASRTRAVVTSSGGSRVSTSSGSSGAVSVNGSSSTTGDAGGSTATTT